MGRQRSRAAVVSTLVALAGVVVTMSIAASLDHRETLAGDARMDRNATVAAAAISSETRRYLDTLRTTAAAAGAQEALTATEYSAITQPLRTMKLAGATSIAFLVPVPDGTAARVQQRWRERGVPDLELVEHGPGDRVYSIFGTSLDGLPAPGGVDLMLAEAPAATLTESRRTGRPSVSAPYQLIVDRVLPADRRQNSFVLTAPVYTGAGQTFTGWIMLGVRGQNFMGATMAAAGQGLLDMSLTATSRTDRTETTVAALRAATPGLRDVHRTISVPVADGTWTLRLAAHAASLSGAHTDLPLVVGAGGLALTLLLTALIWVLATDRERAHARVRGTTAELRAGEAESQRQADLLRTVLDGISDGVTVAGPDGRFLLVNPAARRIVGRRDADGGMGTWQAHYGFFRLDGVTPFPDDELPLARALGGENCDHVEIVVRNEAYPEGRVISVSARPIETASGRRGAVAVFHDITARKHAETELRGFAGVVAHDLKAPLTAVRGYAELVAECLEGLAEGYKATEEWAGRKGQPAFLDRALRSADKVIGGADRMQRLITELLDYTAARDATLRIEEVDLRALVDDVVAARADAPPGTESAPELAIGPLPWVRGDPVLLRQVLDNLIGNAIKYTAADERPRITITARVDGRGEALIRVADRGIGIPEGEHAAVFDSFHRAGNGVAVPGTGLGLAICRRIVERHGGHIEAEPHEGGGTVFAFTIWTAPKDSCDDPPLSIDPDVHPAGSSR
ncbi:ATP-binding protein [Actinoplanes sp. NBRC 101535]|uniref:ATP-binding protein n=1 Tax=Actinoplanes sp. NBRC 101535 TaxID=3032196 RepID=UPI0024A48577|nr:ATP-binding protein [Actinoplanes sp. NBRC 101535]GLY07342.1 hypothetical protein Acsp01_77210 [Actinoplanes sp. NBRC 101535]